MTRSSPSAVDSTDRRADRTRSPPRPFGFSQHQPFFAVYETDRRSVYLMQQRLKKHPFLETFDGADPNATTAQRPFNITPIQALTLMNDPFLHVQASHFADRLAREAVDDAGRIDRDLSTGDGQAAGSGRGPALLGLPPRDAEALRQAATPALEVDRAAWSSLIRVLF